ncbi:MAG: WecB/TagA/CpsF family glycosyltransferase [Chloroflexota bacterium]
MRKLSVILGVPIDDLTMPQAMDRIGAFITAARRDGRLRQIATVNADFVVKSFQDPELLDILQHADMLTADGMPLVWGARLLGVPLEGRVTGADMVPALAQRAAQEGWSLYFLGAAPGVAARAGEILQERYPGLEIAGVYSPPLSTIFEMEPAIVERINASGADVLLVAFGNPKQEKWINMHRTALTCAVAVGVGGSFDFIAGQTKRAPAWMQKSGLEWLYRLLQEPRRLWKRYVVDMAGFGAFFLWQWWQNRRGARRATVLPRTEAFTVGSAAVIAVSGRLDLTSRDRFLALVDDALADDAITGVIVNLAETTFVDSAGMGALVQVAKRARERGGEVRLAAAPRPVAQALAAARLDRLFEMAGDLEAALAGGTVEPGKPAPAAPAEPRPAGDWFVLPLPRQVRVDALDGLKTTFDEAAGLHSQIILDCSGAEFIDSAGLAVIIGLQKRLAAGGGALRLAALSPNVQRIVQLSRLDRVFDLYPSVKAATGSRPDR